MITKTKNAQCRLTPTEYARLTQIAKDNDVKVSDVVRWAVREYMSNHVEQTV